MRHDGNLSASADVVARAIRPHPREDRKALVWKRWLHSFTRNPAEKLLSLVIAVGLWFSVTQQLEFEQTLVFPIEYANRPAGLTPIDALPTEAKARVRGRGKFLRYALRDAVCRVDLSGNQVGLNTIAVNGANVIVAGDTPVSRIVIEDPPFITAEFDETVIRDVPITVDVIGQPAPRYTQVGRTFVNPPIARVKGPRRLVDEIALVPTVQVGIGDTRNTVRKSVRLALPASGTVEVTPEMVEIGITIEPLITRTIEGVELALAELPQASWKSAFHPRTIDIEISGARSIVEVAAREVSSLVFTAPRWSIGTSTLRFKQTGGREIVFAPIESFPLVTAPVEGGTNGPPAGPEPRTTRRAPVAVHGEIVATLPLPRDVHVLKVVPAEIVVAIQRGEPEPPQ
ncbi:MAG: CdaR family protein [bacterium]